MGTVFKRLIYDSINYEYIEQWKVLENIEFIFCIARISLVTTDPYPFGLDSCLGNPFPSVATIPFGSAIIIITYFIN